eukprot:jgi/Psemu1/318710/estExt_fgenesh1_pm.C_1090002
MFCMPSSQSQAAPLRLSLVGQNSNSITSSQKKKRKSNTIAGPSSLDEENKLQVSTNLFVDTNFGLSEEESCQQRLNNPSASEVSSVSQRREWLKSFENKQKSNIFRSLTNTEETEATEATETTQKRQHVEHRDAEKNVRQSPPVSPKANVSINRVSNSATKPIQRKPIMNRRASSAMIHSWQAKSHEGVQATDEGYASVASLSKWLESDPTASKKKRQVRRGRNILSKSRQFEKDQGDVIIVENNISRGAVGDKKKWLQNAFQGSAEEDPDDDTYSAFSGYSGFVQSDVGGRSIRSYPRFNRPGAQTEIITDDAASSLSVSDKKDWLKNAFSKPKASTDVLQSRVQTRDEAASRAKMMFKQRSSRQLSAGSSHVSLKPVQSYKAKEDAAQASAFDSNEASGTNRVVPEDNAVAASETTIIVKPDETEYGSKETVQIDEDQTPVDFRAARKALIERSKRNGHSAQVVNKVFLRKKKFEKLEEESRRKSIGVGLVIKTSWDLADTSNGRPSNAYEKKIVQSLNTAPKKSFEDLP